MSQHARLGVLFDLDGTLLDTLSAIGGAANYALEQMGQAARPVRSFLPDIGYGLEYLLARSLDTRDAGLIETARRHFRAFYDGQGESVISIYPGINDMLAALGTMPVVQAVLSNKPHKPTCDNVRQFFPSVGFSHVYGQRSGVPVKPDAGSVAALLEATGLPAERWVMVGDSDADMQLAANAGMMGLGVLWGFRDEEVLRQSGAQIIASRPEEVTETIRRLLAEL